MYSKIIPIKNPNYEMKENVSQLIEIVNNSKNTPIIECKMIDGEQCDYIIGVVDNNAAPIYKDDFIYDDITLYLERNIDDYEWYNTSVYIDENNNIKGLQWVEYKRKE